MLGFDRLDAPTQLVVVALLTGTMAGGAFALATLPSACLAFIWTLALGSAGAASASGFAHGGALAWLFGFFGLTLTVAGFTIARLFARRHESEREAARQGEVVSLLLRDFEESSADVLWEVDALGRLVQVSERLAQWLRIPASAAGALSLMQVLESLQDPEQGPLDGLARAFARGEAFRDVVIALNLGEGTRWWTLTAKPLLGPAGRLLGWRGVISDVSGEHQSRRHLDYLAHHDSLTGLANRVSVRGRLNQLIGAAQAGNRRGALMCLDLDHFKTVNDSAGHSAGDALLCAVAHRLQDVVRKSDLCGRLGGDEFAIVLDDLRSDDEAVQLAQRLLAEARLPVHLDGMTLSTGLSIGIAFVPDHGRSVDELLAAADFALYAAKAAGRGGYQVFDGSLAAAQRRRGEIEQALRDAERSGGMELHYQPQVALGSWRVVGAEALLRWRHPRLGWVSPAEFIGVAEETGHINRLGHWVLEQACADALKWPMALRVAVNVSVVQLSREGFAQEVEAVLRRHGLPADRLELEITESALMQNLQAVHRNLHAIKQLGVRIALDDFGTGYSSLAYLRQFPFDKLKIDRAFIGELMQASDARAIVRTMLDMARVLGMETVAEGVEEPAQMRVLQRVGCNALQGFLVARPMGPAPFAAFLAAWDTQRRPEAPDEGPVSLRLPFDSLH